MEKSIFKQPLFWVKSLILTIIFISGYIYFSNLQYDFLQNNRLLNIGDITSTTVSYLWTAVQSVNFTILTFLVLLILIIIIHVILIFQEGFDKNHGQ